MTDRIQYDGDGLWMRVARRVATVAICLVPMLHITSASAVAKQVVTVTSASTATATVTITVNPVNDPPVAVDDTVTTDEDTPVDIDPLANDSDPDGDALTITEINGQPIAEGETITLPSGATVTLQGGQVLYAPPPNFNGMDAFAYTVSDG